MGMEKLLKETVAVVGMGYVGLPLAIAFAKKYHVIGYDLNEKKIDLYKSGIDPTEEVGNDAVRDAQITFTTDATLLKTAKYIIVAVPTPVNKDNSPDLRPVEGASRIVGKYLAKGSIVIYESTVYPGVTEDICLPILEQESGMKGGSDFKIAYSPERVNPGDKVHRLNTIVKVVSGMDDETLEQVAALYDTILNAGVHKASSIKVAEAAKLVENAQRDINIAFMNEVAVFLDKMGVSTHEVVAAMKTKWNALNFVPGLVGGHCIGVDPYYLVERAAAIGCQTPVISAGRERNNGMSEFIARKIISRMLQLKKNLCEANIYIFGVTFKENCPDVRNSRVFDIIRILAEDGIAVKAVDAWADKDAVKREYGVELVDISEVKDADCLAFLVAHREYCDLGVEDLQRIEKAGETNLVLDLKNIFNKESLEKAGFAYWSL